MRSPLGMVPTKSLFARVLVSTSLYFFLILLTCLFIHKSELGDTCWSRSFHVLLQIMDQVSPPCQFSFFQLDGFQTQQVFIKLQLCTIMTILQTKMLTVLEGLQLHEDHIDNGRWSWGLNPGASVLLTIHQTLKTVESWPGNCWLFKHEDLHQESKNPFFLNLKTILSIRGANTCALGYILLLSGSYNTYP